jgi:hypothetical protein
MRQVERIAVVASDFGGAAVWLVKASTDTNAVLVGNVCTLRWTGGVVFEEHLTAIKSKRSMAWDFVFNALEVLIAVEPRLASQGDIVNI